MNFSLFHIQWNVLRCAVAAVKDKINEIVFKYKKRNENVLRRLESKTSKVNNKSNKSPFSSLPLLYT